GVARLGDEAGVQHQILQTQSEGTVEGPLEALEALSPGCRVAEAAGLLDGLRRRVVLAREAEHRAGQTEAGGLGHFRQAVAFLPRRVVRVAASDLHDIQAEAVEEPFKFWNTLDLQRPAAHADGEWFNCHGSNSLRKTRNQGPETVPLSDTEVRPLSKGFWDLDPGFHAVGPPDVAVGWCAWAGRSWRPAWQLVPERA